MRSMNYADYTIGISGDDPLNVKITTSHIDAFEIVAGKKPQVFN